MLKILLIEPYYTGSHKKWANDYRRLSNHNVKILSLKGQFWKWRMHGGAVTLADKFNKINILNSFISLSIIGLGIFYFLENYYIIIFLTSLFYLSIGSIFLINFNIINSNLKNNLIVFGVASYSISENIGSFLGPNIIGSLISFKIDYFLLIFIFIFLMIFFIFNFLQKE